MCIFVLIVLKCTDYNVTTSSKVLALGIESHFHYLGEMFYEFVICCSKDIYRMQ